VKTANGERVPESLDEIVHRCSHLEGFVWLLWRTGVVRIEDGKVLVNGVNVPDEWSDLIPVVVEEFQQSALAYQHEQAMRRGVLNGGTGHHVRP
jgi:hypothetical protein